LRSELKNSENRLRTEFKTDIKSLRAEMNALKAKLA
jgi:hypothetical protein